ncbi:hypothetical protein D7221_02680 [Legionella pneumophila]|uniref:Uncharacterized protein n=1 Tax=Legionella pneumophila (strain Lens) TaxID=297245 RepID=Q5WU83_LEGPL|nr:hypothetical protein BE841_01085 [Legionella pneumophila subsp. pneumophila]RYW85736.1 hypothetical protein D7216_01810 [Legionella pneumophila]CAH16527.1 hypothetical protein lpl2287 [Legionella pneumophila str. Lens]AOW55249.1 hypothetical protein BE842_07670 [Legionella pneumophila subsp. pneumophila]AOW59199.1 hypothetical protein BE843_13460 [Legionella pneumophila subsp. pneumophila]
MAEDVAENARDCWDRWGIQAITELDWPLSYFATLGRMGHMQMVREKHAPLVLAQSGNPPDGRYFSYLLVKSL